MTVQELNTLLGENIRRYRKMKKMRQKEFGAEIGVSKSNACGYEKGKCMPHYKTLVLITYVLGVEVWQLFRKEEENGN